MCDPTIVRATRAQRRGYGERPPSRALVSSYPHAFRAQASGARLVAVVAALALAVVATTPALAQEATSIAGPRVLAYTLDHQSAADAVSLVREMLSPMGTVELQPGGNTLVLRDHDSVLGRVETALERFDHPPRALRFDIHLLRASNRAGRGGAPETVTRRLREHLKFEHYDLLAEVPVTALEGQEITYSLGSRYGVSFRPGSMIQEGLRLHGFRIVQKPPVTTRSTNKSRQPEPREMIQTDLNLLRDKQFTLVLSQGQGGGEALAVVITFRTEDASTQQRPRRSRPER